METFDYRPDAPSSGRARGSGGCYHLSFRSGSRAHGSCAMSAHDYVTRSEGYDDPERDAAIYTESDHLPAWAQGDAREYWDAADVYERANGRLYISADFALPRGLDVDEQVELTHTFAQALTGDERLPYTLAIHAGKTADGQDHNPHAHLMISERQNDGIPRSRAQWFRRANREHPDRGGAPKSRTFHGREWMEHARERWAMLMNAALERAGRHERVDHRSYARQGIDLEPGRHIGPAGAYMMTRGFDHDRFGDAVAQAEQRDALRAVDRQIEAAEMAMDGAVNERDVATGSSWRGGDEPSRGR